MGEGASFALGPPGPPPREREGLPRRREREGLPRLRGGRWSPAHTYSSSGAFPVGGAWGECVLVCARTPPVGVLCGRGGGRSGYGPSPQDLPAKHRPVGST